MFPNKYRSEPKRIKTKAKISIALKLLVRFSEYRIAFTLSETLRLSRLVTMLYPLFQKFERRK